jgi:hypothetical protein
VSFPELAFLDSGPGPPLRRQLRDWFDGLTSAYEAIGSLGLTPDDWPRLTALFDRMYREGVSAATEAEVAWLHDLEERLTFELARALVSGPGRDNAIARARLTDAYLRRRRRRTLR